MLGYYDVFPEKLATEIRVMHVFDSEDEDEDEESSPIGIYAFREYYCTDLTCNCQRVVIKVLHYQFKNSQPEDIATISYGWGEDQDLNMLLPGSNDKLSNPFLDPLHYQSRHAEGFLRFWANMFETDPAYADRIKRHYDEIRAVCGEKSEAYSVNRYRPNRPVYSPTLTKEERRVRSRKLAKEKKQRKAR